MSTLPSICFRGRHVAEHCVTTLKTRNASHVTTPKTATLETRDGANLVPGSVLREKADIFPI